MKLLKSVKQSVYTGGNTSDNLLIHLEYDPTASRVFIRHQSMDVTNTARGGTYAINGIPLLRHHDSLIVGSYAFSAIGSYGTPTLRLRGASDFAEEVEEIRQSVTATVWDSLVGCIREATWHNPNIEHFSVDLRETNHIRILGEVPNKDALYCQ